MITNCKNCGDPIAVDPRNSRWTHLGKNEICGVGIRDYMAIIAEPDIETMDTVEYEGQTWQVSATTEGGYELIGYGDVHDYVDFGNEASMKLIAKG